MVSTIAAHIVEQVAGRYGFRGPGVVDALDNAGADVAALLLEAADQLTAHFGPATSLVVELFADPDDDEDPGTLFVLVQTSLPWDRARAVMGRFWTTWWLPVAPRAHGRLNFDLELV